MKGEAAVTASGASPSGGFVWGAQGQHSQVQSPHAVALECNSPAALRGSWTRARPILQELLWAPAPVLGPTSTPAGPQLNLFFSTDTSLLCTLTGGSGTITMPLWGPPRYSWQSVA